MELGSGVVGVEPPVYGGTGGVALLHQGMDFPPESLLVPLLQAATGQYAELAAMFSQLPC